MEAKLRAPLQGVISHVSKIRAMTFRRLVEAALFCAFLSGCGGDEAQEPPESVPTEPVVSTVARGLDTPWEIAFLPDGRALISERPGRVRLLDGDVLAEIEVEATGEGGLLGMAVDPDFAETRFVYLYRTVAAGNEVVRYRLEGSRLEEDEVLVDGIRAAPIHDGGRLRFGPDGALYATTGDASQPELAQDPESLNGKVLRIADGDVEVFSLGHRNPQGLDFEPGSGRLFSTEHGPEGDDEINLLEAGRNYGWPGAEGREHAGFTAPLVVYGESIAPSGATFVRREDSAWSGDFLVASLAGEQLRRLRFDGSEAVVDEPLFERQFGRLRTVVEGPDGALYMLTSNTDGRGTPRPGDDRVLRVEPPRE